MNETVTIIIPFVPPTINKYIGRSNIFEYQKDKKNVHKAISLLTSQVGKEFNINKCKMTITYYFKDRRRHDPANYDKFILDGLVEAGVITDDNYSVITEFTTKGGYDKENPRTEIIIDIIE